MRTFISGPTIAALTQTPRMTVNDHMRAAVYGPTYRIGRMVYVALENVEHVEGRKFTDAQLEAASAGLPDRVITIKEEAAV